MRRPRQRTAASSVAPRVFRRMTARGAAGWTGNSSSASTPGRSFFSTDPPPSTARPTVAPAPWNRLARTETENGPPTCRTCTTRPTSSSARILANRSAPINAACGPVFPATSAKPHTAELGAGAARPHRDIRGDANTGLPSAATEAQDKVTTVSSKPVTAHCRTDAATLIIAVAQMNRCLRRRSAMAEPLRAFAIIVSKPLALTRLCAGPYSRGPGFQEHVSAT